MFLHITCGVKHLLSLSQYEVTDITIIKWTWWYCIGLRDKPRHVSFWNRHLYSDVIKVIRALDMKEAWHCGEIAKMILLQLQYCGEDLVGHGESGNHAHHPGQTPARLRQLHHIGYRVDKTWPYKEAEVEQSCGKLRSCQSVEQTDHHKGNNVLQVILVASGDKEQSSFLHTRLTFAYEEYQETSDLRTRSTSSLTRSIFFLSSASLAMRVSSMLANACLR